MGWPMSLVSAPVPLDLILTGFDWVGAGPWGFRVLGRGLTIFYSGTSIESHGPKMVDSDWKDMMFNENKIKEEPAL